jgi:pimeloyl-ACP methyl ester carboxylesterase
MAGSRGQVLTAFAGALVGVLMAIWVGASFAAERVTLHPRRWADGPTPAQLGHAYQDVAFRDHAGLTLRGWWMPGTRRGTVVMVHGWTSSRRETMGKAGYLLDAGYSVLVFDLRGHGASDGDYTTLGYREPDDVAAAVAFARSRAPGPIALLGYSMGGALAVETGARDPDVAAVIEDSGFGNLANVFSAGFQRLTGFPALPFGLPLVTIGQIDLRMPLAGVRPIDDAARLHKPLLAIVGTADRIVPPTEGYDLYRAAPGPKQLLVVPGAGHVDGYRVAPARYRQTVLSFLASAIG